MKYGVYQDFADYSALHTTTIDEKKAIELACLAAIDRGGSWSVFQLGPNTPDRVVPFMSLQPKLVYSCQHTKA